MPFKNMKIIRSKKIKDVLVIEPSINWDNRGNIYTSFEKDSYKDIMPKELDFIHDKFALSRKNVLRGLHGDFKTWKLVSCVFGEIFEVVVDMREESKTYKMWDSFILNADSYRQVLIPPGFVNGYYVVSEQAVFHYKLAYSGEYFDADKQITIRWDSPDLNILWPCEQPILQERDKL